MLETVPPARLASIAAGLAAAVAADDLAVAPDGERRYARLLQTDAYEAWLIAWAPGGSLDLHDHGGSAGEVVVVTGDLLERFTDRRCRHSLRTHRVRAGQSLAIGPNRVHGVWNPGPATALSVHVYSPPLSAMTFYDPRSLTPLRTEPADISRVTVSRIDQVLADVRRQLPHRPTAAEVPALRARGALLVDIRPVEQRTRDGELEGAVVVDRNVLEWRLDPTSPHRIPEVTDTDQEVVVVCNEGYASSLAALSLQGLGFHRATDLDGGIQALLR